MEMTDLAFTGINNKSHGMASAFSHYTYFKKRCLSFTKKIKKRILNIITNDEILRERLLGEIELLEKQIKAISSMNNNDIEIIAYLFKLISYLLGWDFYDGKFYRTPIYYQTQEEQEESLMRLSKLKTPSEICYRKRKIIKQLLSEDVPYPQIALILGITEANIKQLEKAEYIDKLYQTELGRI